MGIFISPMWLSGSRQIIILLTKVFVKTNRDEICVSQFLNNRGSFTTVDTEIKLANGVCFILNIRKLSFCNVKSPIADPIYQNSTVPKVGKLLLKVYMDLGK